MRVVAAAASIARNAEMASFNIVWAELRFESRSLSRSSSRVLSRRQLPGSPIFKTGRRVI